MSANSDKKIMDATENHPSKVSLAKETSLKPEEKTTL